MLAMDESTEARNLVLVVDDDPQVRTVLARYLTRHGFAVAEAGSGSEMKRELERVTPMMVLLDIGLPDTDGFSLLRELRANASIGIIIVSGMGDQVDRVVGLELGADDYLVKPLDYRELVARIRTVRRRIVSSAAPAPATSAPADAPLTSPRVEVDSPSAEIMEFDGWRLDVAARALFDPDGGTVALTTMEFDTLVVLASRPGVVLSRDQLLQNAARRNWDPNDRAIDAVIVKLRRKLKEDSREPQMIKTVRGVGYVFAARMRA